ncbi:hypothetical protein BH09CHL1_BH09CHL1_36040 [soil metagenome]
MRSLLLSSLPGFVSVSGAPYAGLASPASTANPLQRDSLIA